MLIETGEWTIGNLIWSVVVGIVRPDRPGLRCRCQRILGLPLGDENIKGLAGKEVYQMADGSKEPMTKLI